MTFIRITGVKPKCALVAERTSIREYRGVSENRMTWGIGHEDKDRTRQQQVVSI